MNRQQKIILGILALADLLVIALMGSYAVITTLRREAPSPQTPPATLSPCTEELLTVLTDAGYAPTVDWEADLARIDLKPQTSSPATIEAAAQMLWPALDTLAVVLPDSCPTPQILLLTLSTHDTAVGSHHTVRLSGSAFSAWMREEMGDDDLAAHASYRVAP